MENTKGFATFAILVFAVAYGVSVVARKNTRYAASPTEVFLVAIALVLTFIMVPAFLGATLASRPH